MKFKEFCEYLNKIEKISSKIDQTIILAEVFKKLEPEELKKAIYLLTCKVKPNYEQNELGLGEKHIIKSLSKITGYDSSYIEKEYKKLGDLGLVAEKLIKNRKQKNLFSKELKISDVYDNLLKISEISGEKSIDLKIKYFSELLNSCSPVEAKYLVRIPLENLRLGIGEPTIMDALSYMLVGSKNLREKIEEKYNIYPNLAEIGEILKKHGIEGLNKIKISYFVPLRPALAERLKTSKEIYEKLGKCACEGKYDGMRIQIHKKGNDVKIYSRKLENVTYMFPDIVEETKSLEFDAIFEGEAISYDPKTKKFLPFQVTMHRKRKYDIDKLKEEIPLKVYVFDIMLYNDKEILNEKYINRRKLVEKLFKNRNKFEPTEMKMCSSPEEIQEFFDHCVSENLEGIIAKDLNAKYIAGKRKFAWIKLKKSYSSMVDTVDAVILGYFKGKGQRAQFDFGGFLAGVYDNENDVFKTIAKVGSGFTEEDMVKLKEMLDKIKVDKKPANVISNIDVDVWVEPKYVVTLSADEITVSNVHTCGKTKKFALRFPRMVKIREDKNPYDATTEEEIEEMYELQFS